MKSAIIAITIAVSLVSFPLLQQITSGETLNGKSLLEQRCAGCHSLMKITSKKKTSEEWAKSVRKMRDLMDKKGKSLNDDEEKMITEYLALEFKK